MFYLKKCVIKRKCVIDLNGKLNEVCGSGRKIINPKASTKLHILVQKLMYKSLELINNSNGTTPDLKLI